MTANELAELQLQLEHYENQYRAARLTVWLMHDRLEDDTPAADRIVLALNHAHEWNKKDSLAEKSYSKAKAERELKANLELENQRLRADVALYQAYLTRVDECRQLGVDIPAFELFADAWRQGNYV